MPIIDEKADAVVRQFAKGLRELDLELIAYILDPELRFLYRSPDDYCCGMTTDIRYIGHLYKTFNSMKKEGEKIELQLCHIFQDSMRYTGIILFPPHDSRIVFPLQYLYRHQNSLEYYLNNDVRIMFIKVKNDLINRIKCYTPRQHYFPSEGTYTPINE